ncbi:MAG: FAD-dependent oxidoreductase [Deltaproteobacteria bacterium]|nr:FAD-dependent oxidoreductase [Deltaproteobacteria bacterium]
MTGRLFSPLNVGPYRFKNRIVMPAMHLGMCDDGDVSQSELRFYAERAASDVALVMVGLCNTHAEESSAIQGVLELSEDRHVEPMRRLARVIHDGGALCAVQLSPVTGYNNPAWKPDETMIQTLVESIGMAAGRAKRAGFDFVELMLSGGSFLSHMLSPHHNTYNFENYSGSLENRLRAPLAAMSKIKQLAQDMPIIVRMHGHEYMENGFGLAEAAQIAKALETAGACAINVTVAGHRTRVPQITRQRSAMSFAFLGRNIKDAVDVPVFFGSRIRTSDDARAVLRESGVDAVTVGRALIADARFAQKIKKQVEEARLPLADDDETVNCIACCNCLDMAFSKKPVNCTVNPQIQWEVASGAVEKEKGFEDVCGKRVLVAGSGPAGLNAAMAFARNGAEVILLEQAAELGGKWRRISQMNSHGDTQGALAGTIATLNDCRGVDVRTNTSLTPALAESLQPDILVLATGAVPRKIAIKGLETHPRVFHVADLIDDDLLPPFKDAVIVGGNAAGVTMALHLATPGYATNEAVGYLHRFGSEAWANEALAFAPSRRITVLKRRGFFGKGMGRSTRWTAVQEMDMYGVRTLDKVQYEEVTPEGIWVLRGKNSERLFIESDLLVLSTGFEPAVYPDEYTSLVQRVIVAGDAKQIGNITTAIGSIFENENWKTQ